jgi:hypothetical protein
MRLKLQRTAPASLASFAVLVIACSSSTTTGGGVDAGPDGAEVDGGLQICLCCGTSVSWPAEQSCSAGACDGYCNGTPDAGKKTDARAESGADAPSD